MAGTVLAVLLYKLVTALEYESAQSEEEEVKFLPRSRKSRRSSTAALASVQVGPSLSNPAAVNESSRYQAPLRSSSIKPNSEAAGQPTLQACLAD
jgi:hypothetical protein